MVSLSKLNADSVEEVSRVKATLDRKQEENCHHNNNDDYVCKSIHDKKM